MNVKKILIPMDFSECAINALRIAKPLAKSLGASIEMVTAIETPHVHPEVVGVDSVIQPLVTDYMNQIEGNYTELFEKEGLDPSQIETKKYNSSYQNALYSAVEQGDIDLVISGTKNDHSILEKVLGGKTADLISISKTPVLVIPENITNLSCAHIGLAINFEEELDLQKMEIVKFLATEFKAKLNILFISKEGDQKYVFDDQKVKLANYFNNYKIEFSSLKQGNTSITNELNHAIEKFGIDILFMLPKNHKFFDRLINKSITKEMAMKANIPLLTVHE